MPPWDLPGDLVAGGHRHSAEGTYGRVFTSLTRPDDPPMIESLGHRLRVVFGRPANGAEPASAPSVDTARATQQVEFVAYGEDCVLSGVVRLASDRLTDMLNEHDEYLLVDVLAEGLAGDRGVEVTEVLVRRDELFLVHATGPRGNQDRRHRTRSHPVAIQMGPYHVRGYLHVWPGADPVHSILRRQPMVPLTEAWIEFPPASDRQRRRVGTVVVNREQIDWIVPAIRDEVEMPDLPLSAEQGRLLKDYTGALFEGR
jgi:hypothetical protein